MTNPTYNAAALLARCAGGPDCACPPTVCADGLTRPWCIARTEGDDE
jgi:hypothetical protein